EPGAAQTRCLRPLEGAARAPAPGLERVPDVKTGALPAIFRTRFPAASRTPDAGAPHRTDGVAQRGPERGVTGLGGTALGLQHGRGEAYASARFACRSKSR